MDRRLTLPALALFMAGTLPCRAGEAWTTRTIQNEALQRYFIPVCFTPGEGARRVEHLNRRIDIPSTGGTNPVFLSQCVEQRIADFTRTLEASLRELDIAYSALALEREHWYEEGRGKPPPPEQLKHSLTRVRQIADKLHGSLKGIFRFPSAGDDAVVELDQTARDSAFEMAFYELGALIHQAERQVRDYFSGTGVVDVRNQDDDNMVAAFLRLKRFAALLEREF